jgi:hypothetical protein
MTAAGFKSLFTTTLTDPAEAGRQVIALGLPAQALWMALSLISVVSSLIFAGIMQAAPMPPDEMGAILRNSPAYSAPLVFALLQWGRAVVSVFVLYWVGRALGGQGRLGEVLAVLTWLQAVTFVLIAGLFVLGVVLPMLSTIMMLVMAVWWIWATISLLDVAHGFDSKIKAAGVLIVSILGITVGLWVFVGAVTAVFMGV